MFKLYHRSLKTHRDLEALTNIIFIFPCQEKYLESSIGPKVINYCHNKNFISLWYIWYLIISVFVVKYHKTLISYLGTPKPTIKWLHNGRELTGREPGISILEDDTLLVIASVTPYDNGEYICVAVNEAGTTERKYNLKVHGKCS